MTGDAHSWGQSPFDTVPELQMQTQQTDLCNQHQQQQSEDSLLGDSSKAASTDMIQAGRLELVVHALHLLRKGEGDQREAACPVLAADAHHTQGAVMPPFASQLQAPSQSVYHMTCEEVESHIDCNRETSEHHSFVQSPVVIRTCSLARQDNICVECDIANSS